MSASTATATTATAEDAAGVPAVASGRFAPSPTGPLHLGSLTSALGSALDARRGGARWLLRMEDLDRARVVPGAADAILRTLESLGFQWDGPVLYQSTRLEAYRDALRSLQERGLTFECSCSRAQLSAMAGDRGYPGTCRNGPTRPGATATRLRIDENAVETFVDRIQGTCRIALRELGDVVLRRRDGVIAYQLAVVVDDAAQGITDVVRGCDLLESTAWQRALQRALGYPCPRYAHLPLIVEPDGAKLAKSRRSVALDPAQAAPSLVQALGLLGQSPPPELARARVAEIWSWAVGQWDRAAIRGVREVRA